MLTASDLRASGPALALAVLRNLPERAFVRRSVWIQDALASAMPVDPTPGYGMVSRRDVVADHPEEALVLAIAFAQLERDGVLVQWPPHDPQYTKSGFADVFTVTPFGRRIRQTPNAGEMLDARRGLNVSLHTTLEARVRGDVDTGAFETAAFKALRAIEARVRKLTNEPRKPSGDRLVGTTLMQHAFSSPAGPLTDPLAEPGEQVGTMQLFCGAFGAVRNLLAHTEQEFGDPVEAAEYVLLADLLMRLVDRAEERLRTGGP